jgi:hypothetical protein
VTSNAPVAVQSRRPSILALASVLTLGWYCVGSALAGEPPDAQLWNEAKVTIRLDDRFDLVVGGALRLGDDVSQLVRTSGLLAVNVRLTDFFSLTPTYQYIVDDPVTGERTVENRLGLVPTVSTPLCSAKLALSNGLEFRSFDNKPNSWRWRPKLKLSHLVGSKDLALTGYAAGELFYDFDTDIWTRSRLFAGLEKRLSDNVAIDLYYCRQIELKAGKQDLNIIGISIRIDLDPRTRHVEVEPETE